MKRRRKLPTFLRPDEVIALLIAAQAAVDQSRTASKKRCAMRDLVMIQVALVTGARVAELCALMIEDIDLCGRMVSIVQGKGGRDRRIPLAERVAPMLKEWIGERKTGFLFPGPNFRWLSERTFQGRLAKLGKAAGIAKAVHPHICRHTFCTTLMEAGVSLRVIQELAGHQNLGTTEIYTHVSPAHLRSSINLI